MRGLPGVSAVRRSTELLDERDELVVVDVPGGRRRRCSPACRAAVVAPQRAPRHGRDHLGRADHRAAERVRAEDRLADQVVNELLRRVLVHRDLLEHDLPLGVEVVEERREDHVAHHVERGLDVVSGTRE